MTPKKTKDGSHGALQALQWGFRYVVGWVKGKGWEAAHFNRIFSDYDGANGSDFNQPYKQSVWVMRAIKLVSNPISFVDLKFCDFDAQDIDNPDLLEWWDDPFAKLDKEDGIEATVGWMKLTGCAYWILDDSWLVPFPTLERLGKIIIARPGSMRRIKRDGETIAWQYRDAEMNEHTLLPEQVIEHKNWNPYSDESGLGEMQPAMDAAEADYLAGKMERNVWRNNGERAPIFSAENLQKEQVEQIVASLQARKAKIRRGDFSPFFTVGGIKVEDSKISGQDAAYYTGRLQKRHEIYIAFGVPPSMGDIVASYSVGSASDLYRLIIDTCQPQAGKLARVITKLIRIQADREDLRAYFDWDEHPTMQQVRAERMEGAIKFWDRGMPWEKINDHLQLGLPEFDGWDIGYLPFSVAPVGSGLPDNDTQFAEPSDDDAEDPLETLQEVFAQRKAAKAKQTSDERDAKEVATWRQHMADRKPTVKQFENQFRKWLMKYRTTVLQNIERFTAKSILCGDSEHRERKGDSPSLDTNSSLGKAAAADLNANLDEVRSGFLNMMRMPIENGLQAAAKQLFRDLGNDNPWQFPPEEVTAYIATRENYLRGASEKVWERVRDTLQSGIDKGETMQDLAGRVRKEFNGISSRRASTIAQTETANAYSNGRHKAMKQAGIQRKRWLTSGNDNVRDTHRAANGQTVGIDEAYIVGGHELMHPGDSSLGAPPEETINCHCISIPIKAN